jgi:hypothetical protein
MKPNSKAAIPQSEAPGLPGFVPLQSLWQGERAIFPSESSARWFIRANRDALAEARAVGFHAGRLVIHRERFAFVAEEVAIRLAGEFRRRIPSIHAGN